MANNETTAAEAAKKPKMVKIKIIRDCMVGEDIRIAGNVVEATEAQAKELCDTKWKGYHPFYGTMPEFGPLMEGMPNPLDRKMLVRAVRVA